LVILCLTVVWKTQSSPGYIENAAPQLEGSWLVTVSAEGLGSWQALESYNAGGAMMASDPGVFPLYPMTTPLHGTWARKGQQQFVFTMMNFQYDNVDDGYPDGLQKNIIKATLTIEKGGNSYIGQGLAYWYDSTGALIITLPFTTHATRILAE